MRRKLQSSALASEPKFINVSLLASHVGVLY